MNEKIHKKNPDKTARCAVCGAAITIRGGASATGIICDGCAQCRCGSGKPPGLCHGRSISGNIVPLVSGTILEA